MTEQEWLAATDTASLKAMMEVVEKASPRKVRLLLCACERRFWNQLPVEQQRSLEDSERYADGLMTWPEYVETADARWKALWGAGDPIVTIWDIGQDLIELKMKAGRGKGRTEVAAQCTLLRELFGTLPFRAIVVDHSWLSSTVKHLADAICQEQTFDQLPILADALEEAGCSDAEILAHCRRPGPHVRGCWVVDLLLGKE